MLNGINIMHITLIIIKYILLILCTDTKVYCLTELWSLQMFPIIFCIIIIIVIINKHQSNHKASLIS